MSTEDEMMLMAQQMTPKQLERCMRQLSSLQRAQSSPMRGSGLLGADALDQIDERVQQLEQASDELVRVSQAIPANCQQAKFMIESTFNDMAALLAARKHELLQALEESSADRSALLEQQQTEVAQALEELGHMRRAVGSPEEPLGAGPAQALERILGTHKPRAPCVGDGVCVDLESARKLPGLLQGLTVELAQQPGQPVGTGFDPRLCHAEIVLQDKNTSLRMSGHPKWATALGPRLVPSSQHFWWVRLGQSSNVMVGVAVDSCMLLDTHEEQRAWFYYCHTGHKYQAGRGTAYGGKCEPGDVVGVFYDADAHSVAFYKNAICLGPAFTGLPPNLRPAVMLHDTHSQVCVDFGAKHGATAAFMSEEAPKAALKPGKTPRMLKIQREAAGKSKLAAAAALEKAGPVYYEGPEVASRVAKQIRSQSRGRSKAATPKMRKAWA